MKVYRFPSADQWPELLKRPAIDSSELRPRVSEIIDEVRADRDDALLRLTERFDGVRLKFLEATQKEFFEAEAATDKRLKEAIALAKSNIEQFHSSQIDEPRMIETAPGVVCWRKSVAIERVGLYVPAGSAPLFSTVLMLAVPAKLAGCREIVLCSPPDASGSISAATLYAAKECGVTRVFKIGGAQAIAAMAFGTESVPRVDKIFGPGNQYVTEAKLQVSLTGTAIDMPAGPSEVAVVADETSIPAFVAADLLSQAEHGSDSQVLLVSTSESIVERTLAEIEKQIGLLPRREIALAALANSKAIVTESLDVALDLVDSYAPEHLILAVADPESAAERIANAGSVFLGNYSCEAAGDYASGTNHTLPTNGCARAFSGVSVDSFVKKITFQKLTADGIRSIGPAIETLAEAENLRAHRNAVSIRLESLKI